MNKRRLEILEYVRATLGRMEKDADNLWNQLDDGHRTHALRAIEQVEGSIERAKHRVDELIEDGKREAAE